MIDFNRSVRDTSRAVERLAMVETQIRARGVRDRNVLRAMERVPRHQFVPADQQGQAYGDYPLPIGQGQTISQPYIVALMSELLEIRPGCRVLEIGTGSGYQAAVLAEMGARVWSLEILPSLAATADRLLHRLGYRSVAVRAGDGYAGWPEEAPFDGIILTAAPVEVPGPLLDQLAEAGRLVVPEGRHLQELVLYTRKGGKVARREIIPVRFVPMTGRAEKP
ncbi:protein-L-isoaspartate(D-aspartate) O-methyltransferase [bacterium]|nr:protein-L-isoaspartate(D-aspartate) O-methyltransferase [bacterium]